MHIPFWEFLLRVLILYIFVMVALRIMGKREIGQLSIFDFVVSVMIAELSTLPMEDTRIPLYQSLIAIASLVILQIIVAIVQLKSHRFRHWVDGEPTVLIERGKIKDREMKRLRYTAHDLDTQLREQGFLNVADVEFAILETSGKLTVFPKAENRPVTPKDLKVPVTTETIPMPLIIDGKPVDRTLLTLRQDREWLKEQLNHRGYQQIADVFYAVIDARGTIFIDDKDYSEPKDAEN